MPAEVAEFPNSTIKRLNSGTTKIDEIDACWNYIDITGPPTEIVASVPREFRSTIKIWGEALGRE